MNSREFQGRLRRRAELSGLTLSVELAARLEVYYRLLATWNRKINLSGLDLTEATPEALDRLLIEPVVAAKYAPPGLVRRMIDIGSGGGSPAIPFAMALPQLHLLMVESKTRKSVFLREAIRALEMDADVAASRFETLLAQPDLHEAHDLLTVRAVRMEIRILMSLEAFVRPGGLIFLFCRAHDEAGEPLPPPLVWAATHPLVKPLHSRLTVIQKTSPQIHKFC